MFRVNMVVIVIARQFMWWEYRTFSTQIVVLSGP